IAALATLVLGAGFITTGELLAGNVYRPGYIGGPEGPGGDGPQRGDQQITSTAVSNAPPGRRSPTAPNGESSLASVAETLTALRDERMRIAIVGLSPDAFTG